MRFIQIASILLILVSACGGPDPSLGDQQESVSEAVGVGDDPPLPPDGPEPGPNDPPEPAYNLRVRRRSNNYIDLAWSNGSAYETSNAIERRIGPSGTWTTARAWAAQSGALAWVDTSRAPDTLHCYRARSTNSHGSSYSNIACAFTRPATSTAVWRVQLALDVANVSGAGTDDGVRIGLNGASSAMPSGNYTRLDRPGADLEQNSSHRYDLDLGAIKDLGDITQIGIYKPGTDGLCLEAIALFINGVQAFRRDFGNTSSTCRWLDDGTGSSTTFTVTHAQLRAHSSWSGFDQPSTPMTFTQDELRKRVEGLVGNVLASRSDVVWGHISGHAVDIHRIDQDTILIDLDLSGEAYGLDPSIDIDIFVDLVWVPGQNPTDWTFEISVSDFDVDTNFAWWVDIMGAALGPICVDLTTGVLGDLTSNCTTSMESYLESRIRDAWRPIGLSIAASIPDFCTPEVEITPDNLIDTPDDIVVELVPCR